MCDVVLEGQEGIFLHQKLLHPCVYTVDSLLLPSMTLMSTGVGHLPPILEVPVKWCLPTIEAQFLDQGSCDKQPPPASEASDSPVEYGLSLKGDPSP